MSVLETAPSNKNFLSSLKFRLDIKKLPHTSYMCQSVNLPSITLGETQGQDTPFIKIPIPGDHLSFGELMITFMVDEDMTNYLELYNWIVAVGYPENFDQFKTLNNKQVGTGDGLYTDGTLTIFTSHSNANMAATFYQLYPTNISDLQFDNRASDVPYVEATASFRFNLFDLKKIT